MTIKCVPPGSVRTAIDVDGDFGVKRKAGETSHRLGRCEQKGSGAVTWSIQRHLGMHSVTIPG
jgi:hypothetical protein